MFRLILKILSAVLVLLGGVLVFFLYSNDAINAVITDEPAGGAKPADYMKIENGAQGSTLSYRLDTTLGLVPVNVVLSEGRAQGHEGVFVKTAKPFNPLNSTDWTMALVSGSDVHNGTILVEVNGSVSPHASRLDRKIARGFIGICFRVDAQTKIGECLYLRPENGPTDDPVRKIHAVQYISLPDWDFFRLRKEAPKTYEAAAPIEPGKWHKMRLEVKDDRAVLFIDDAAKPVLVVDNLKAGTRQHGQVGLWVGPATNGFFRNLKIKTDD